MADVDFSHAVLDVNPNTYAPPMNYSDYVGMVGGGGDLYNSSHSQITAGGIKNIISNTPTKVSILFTGGFIASGTELYFGTPDYNKTPWKVSNISFSSGDTYAFVIDIEVSGNT